VYRPARRPVKRGGGRDRCPASVPPYIDIMAYSHQTMIDKVPAPDRKRVWAALAAMIVVLVFAAWVVFGQTGIFVVIATVGLVALIEPQLGARTIMKFLGGRPLQPRDAPRLYAVALKLSRRASLEAPPMLYLAPLPVPNAFAVGDAGDSAIGLTRSLIVNLTERELEAMLAHEIAHIAAGDTALMRFAEMIRRTGMAITLFGLFVAFFGGLIVAGGSGLLAIWMLAFVPLTLNLLQLALSRAREFAADHDAYHLTGDGPSLASALVKVEQAGRRAQRALLGPMADLRIPVLFRTHPETRERIDRLGALVERERY